ncbi:pseudouridine synthase [Phellopilus nigrolimitatus]|nr:pseudouridine synthase [Phellopilus nigrolimitatus]
MNVTTVRTSTRLARRQGSRTSPRAVPLLYVDRGLIVINKPSGLVCQSDKTWKEARSPWLACHTKLQLDHEPTQIHRLDKHTTGALLLAKSTVHARSLAQQFQAHTIKKTYLAIVRGGRKSFLEAGRGTINTPLRIGLDRVYEDAESGNPALTDWELLGSSDKVPLSLLRLSLHSGIKHQLRVHLANVLHAPILGDTYYSNKAPPREILDIIPPGVSILPKKIVPAGTDAESAPLRPEEEGKPRVFLHAANVNLTRYRSSGPSKRLVLGITAPLPRDFLSICEAADLTRFLSPEYVQGGLKVDDEPVPLDDEISGLEGKWLARESV